jgi:hypothetical protein
LFRMSVNALRVKIPAILLLLFTVIGD